VPSRRRRRRRAASLPSRASRSSGGGRRQRRAAGAGHVARRAIPLDPETLDALRRHGRRQAEERLRAGPEYQTHGLIFATEIGTPFDLGTVRERILRPALERAGLGKLRLYDLRHTHATLPLAMGESIKVVSERLGHSSVALTMDLYQHVSQDMQREIAGKLGALLPTPSTAARA
jgi:integrase